MFFFILRVKRYLISWQDKLKYSSLVIINLCGNEKAKKKSKVNKKIVIALLLIVTFSVIIALGFYQNKAQPTQKKSAKEYFEIIEATVNDGEFRDPKVEEGGDYNTSQVLIIYSISFQLKAKGGDAHNVVVKSWGEAEPEYFEKILKDTSVYVEQSSLRRSGYLSRKTEGKFPFEVKLRSDEAEGSIIIYL